jgi:N utilization substance protein B
MSRARHNARQSALQALYQWQMSGNDLIDIENQFLEEQDMSKVDLKFFKELLHKIPAHIDVIDKACEPYLDRAVDSVDPVERAAIRIGIYELCMRPDIPYRVVINEAVELAKCFGADQGHRYVNSILDKVAQVEREAEISAKKK